MRIAPQGNLVFTLSRCDTGTLTNLIGEDTVELLGHLDLVRLTNTALAGLVISKIGVAGLFSNDGHRKMIIKALPQAEATALADLLDVPAGDDRWRSLLSTSFSKANSRLEKLYAFFGYDYEQSPDREAKSPAVAISPEYPLFAHQRAALIQVMEILERADPPRVLLHMPTGAGKTRTAMNIIANVLRRSSNPDAVVIWLAHSEELCDQAAEEFEDAWEFLGDRQTTVFRHYGSARVPDLADAKKGVLIAGLKLLYEHSLTRQGEVLDLARNALLLVMDEAHQAIAPTYKHLLNLLCQVGKTPILGLSATPGRSFLDAGADLKLANFFANHKVTLEIEGYTNPMQYLQDEGYLARVNTVRLPYTPKVPIKLSNTEVAALREGFDLSPQVLKRLGDDQVRNLLILDAILKEAKKGSKIIVFACSVSHASLLADVLKIKGIAAASVTSVTNPADREARIIAYRDSDEIQILTNFGVLTTGFDAPRTNVAFICRPTQSVILYSQMVGRAARGTRAGGNQECRVFTVVDNLPGVRDISEAFTFWEEIWS